MSFGSQINVAQDFAAPGAPAADPAAPTPSSSQLAPNGCAPVAPPAAPLHRTVSAPTVGVAVPAQPQTQSAPGAAAGPTSSGALMGPPPPQPQHITVERGCQKKTRLVWTEELHMRFLFAVEKIGLRTAVPRTILQVMQVDGLTRENIASHLQKYRRLLEKKAGISGPVGTKDWPKLEAAQTHHLAQLRKQMDSATAAADAATTAAAAAAVAATSAAPATAAVSSGTAADPSSQHVGAPQTTAAAPAAAATPAAAPATAAPPQQAVALPVLGPAVQPPPQQPMAPPVSAPQVLPPGSAAPTWQEQAHPPSCIPPPATPHQLPQPGICPVTPQEPAQVPVPTSDSEGNTLGVPMPQPIMPPLMCVLPQSDGSPALLPMLPAMYMASYGRNTPDFLGTVPLSRQQVPGMGAMPHAPQHPRPYAHAHAHTHPHPAHHMAQAASGMYPGSYGYPAAPPQQYQAMPVAQPAGIGSPMFPSAYPPQMHMAPMPAPMAHDPNMHVQHSSEMMGGMHGAGYAWPRPNGWRPPQSKAGGHQARSTLPPLVSERQRSQHVPLSSGPHSQSAPHMQTRATSGARNNGARAPGSGVVHHHADTGEVNGSFGGGMYHEGAENNGNNTAGRPPRANNRARNRRSHSNGAIGAGMPIDAVDEDAAMGHAADVDWGDDAIEDVKLDPLALTSSTLRIANMKLDPGVVADGAVHGHEVEATLGEIPDADVEDVPGMDLDELGWPAWPEPGTSSGNGEVEL